MNKKIALGFRTAVPVFSKVTDMLTFGKHKGHTIGQVIEDDPGYLLWATDENVVKLSHEIMDLVEEAYYWQVRDEADQYSFGFPTIWDYMGDDD